MQFTGYIPAALLRRDNEVWTDEAVQSLIGQEPRLNYSGDWTKPLGRCRVVDARQDDKGVHMTIEVLREHHEGAVEEVFREHWVGPEQSFSLGPDVSHPVGIGYTVPEQRWTNGTEEDSVRHIVKANLRAAHPMAWPPATEESND